MRITKKCENKKKTHVKIFRKKYFKLMKVFNLCSVNYRRERHIKTTEFLKGRYLENITMNEKIYEIKFLGKFVSFVEEILEDNIRNRRG